MSFRLVPLLALWSAACAAEPGLDPFAAQSPGQNPTSGTQAPQAQPAAAATPSVADPFAAEAAPKPSDQPWFARARFSVGYDSNVTLRAGESDFNSGEESSALQLGGSAGWQGKKGDWRFQGLGTMDYTSYTKLEDQDLLILGLGATATTARQGKVHALIANWSHFSVGGDNAADVFTAGWRGSWIRSERFAWILGAEIQEQDFADNDDASGTLLHVRGGAWKILDAANSKRRLEGELRLSLLSAQADEENYWGSRIRLRPRWNWPQGAHSWEAEATFDAEYRRYDTADSTSETQLRLGASVDRWQGNWALGAYLDTSRRDSDAADADYSRYQLGLRTQLRW